MIHGEGGGGEGWGGESLVKGIWFSTAAAMIIVCFFCYYQHQ